MCWVLHCLVVQINDGSNLGGDLEGGWSCMEKIAAGQTPDVSFGNGFVEVGPLINIKVLQNEPRIPAQCFDEEGACTLD